MHCDLFKIYCAPPNLCITRTWIRRLNFAQRPIFSGLRFFNEPEMSDSAPQLNPSRRTCAQDFYVLGFRGEHVTPRPLRTTLHPLGGFCLNNFFCSLPSSECLFCNSKRHLCFFSLAILVIPSNQFRDDVRSARRVPDSLLAFWIGIIATNVAFRICHGAELAPVRYTGRKFLPTWIALASHPALRVQSALP